MAKCNIQIAGAARYKVPQHTIINDGLRCDRDAQDYKSHSPDLREQAAEIPSSFLYLFQWKRKAKITTKIMTHTAISDKIITL